MLRRAKFEQAIDILRCSVQPILISHLITEANIALVSSKPFLLFLEAEGYLEKIQPPLSPQGKVKDRKIKCMYLTTRKGREALKLLNGPVLKGLLGYREWLQEQKESS